MEVHDDEESYLSIQVEDISNDALLDLVKKFSFDFVDIFELNLMFYYNLLEEKPVPEKQGSLQSKILSSLASAIPSYGKGIGSAITSGEIYILKRLDKKNSIKLSNLVYYYFDNRDIVRKILIEAAVEIFSCFEYQFKRVTCNGGPKRAMHKLAKDASHRSLAYFLEDGEDSIINLSKDQVTKGVIHGNCNNLGQKKGRTVSNTEVKWKTAKLCKKAGIVILENNEFYKNKDTNTKKYGHRRIFSWEDPETIKSNWEADDVREDTKYTLEISDNLINNIQDYVKSKNALEEAQLERETYYKKIINNNEEKQQELLQNIDEVLGELKKNYTEFIETNNNQTDIMVEIKDTQSQSVGIQEEIKLKLNEIHYDVVKTKQTQVTLVEANNTIKNELALIKENQELDKKDVIDVDVVAGAAIDKLKKSAQQALSKTNEDLRENLKKLDVGPQINKETKRTLDKIKKIRIKF